MMRQQTRVAALAVLVVAQGFNQPDPRRLAGRCLNRNRILAASQSSETLDSDSRNVLKSGGLMGGDYAGILVNFDYKGQALPVPDYWVPESMLEWGAVPDFLEILVSEDPVPQERIDWNRHILTVLPETGCGVDNLEVIKSTQSLAIATSDGDSTCPSVECYAAPTGGDGEWLLEIVFGEVFPDDADTKHRVRLGVAVVRAELGDSTGEWKLSTSSKFERPSIQVALERQFDSTSSEGTRADGGGLDGQRVTRWMGSQIQKRSSSFASSGRSSSLPAVLVLPGNLTIASTPSACEEAGAQDGALVLDITYHDEDDVECRRVHWLLDPTNKNPCDGQIQCR